MITPTKLGRDIARAKGHFVCEFDLKRPGPQKWPPFLGSEIRFFALFSKSIHVRLTELGMGSARAKGHIVCEFDLKRP